MATLRDLKARIGSVTSSEKITGAMKMISSAKMNKAVRDIKRLLPFRRQLNDIIDHLMDTDVEFSSPLMEPRRVSHVSVVVAGSDDGLCGAYNVNIVKDLLAHLESLRKEIEPGAQIQLIPVGSKMAKAVSRLDIPGVSVTADVPVHSKSEGDDVTAFAHSLQQDFEAGRTDRVDFVYMGFISPSRQRIHIETLLPVGALTPSEKETKGEMPRTPYIYEPNAAAIFTTVLPLMFLSSVQEAFCENRASEQAARVMAMQSANDNASKLLGQLRLEYNKLRQQSITNELLDILGGQVR